MLSTRINFIAFDENRTFSFCSAVTCNPCAYGFFPSKVAQNWPEKFIPKISNFILSKLVTFSHRHQTSEHALAILLLNILFFPPPVAASIELSPSGMRKKLFTQSKAVRASCRLMAKNQIWFPKRLTPCCVSHPPQSNFMLSTAEMCVNGVLAWIASFACVCVCVCSCKLWILACVEVAFGLWTFFPWFVYFPYNRFIWFPFIRWPYRDYNSFSHPLDASVDVADELNS